MVDPPAPSVRPWGAAGEPFYLYAGAFVVVLVYSLFRWGTSRQAAIGSVIVGLEWFVSVTTDFTGVADAGGGLLVLLFPAVVITPASGANPRR